ncbi:MAG TPA: DbpA RNA binding domain-containing protein, partial [Anaerolineales bacterium]|nr:DbpA RNA binding domain-containing protein [Anaerolineales bacterium]
QELIDAGHDVMNIAAAAIKISRGDEKQRPIAEVAQVTDERRDRDFSRGGRRETFGRSEKPGRFGDKARVKGSRTHEEGMVRLKVNKGKAHNIRPNDIVGQIAFHANIPGNIIGKIRIEEKMSFVDIPEDVVEQVLKHSGNYKIGKDKFSVVKAQ